MDDGYRISGNVEGWRRPPTGPGAHLSIIVPAYNEAARLPPLLRDLVSRFDPATTQIIVVDDGSQDTTARVAGDGLASFPNHRIEVLPVNRGKGAALRHGVRKSTGHQVVFMDADGATDLADIEPLLFALADADIAVGSRLLPGAVVNEPQRSRHLMRRGFNMLVRLATKANVSDSQCGFKAFSGGAAHLLFHLTHLDGFALDAEVLDMAERLGFQVEEVPVHWLAVSGSKIHRIRDSAHLAVSVLRIGFGRAPDTQLPLLAVSRAGDNGAATEELATLLGPTASILTTSDAALAFLPGWEDGDAHVARQRAEQALHQSVALHHISGRSLLEQLANHPPSS